MDANRIETTTGMCVVALTKHLMKKQNIDYEIAYKNCWRRSFINFCWILKQGFSWKQMNIYARHVMKNSKKGQMLCMSLLTAKCLGYRIR